MDNETTPLIGRDREGFLVLRPIERKYVLDQQIATYHILNRFVAIKNYGDVQGFLLDHGTLLPNDARYLVSRYALWCDDALEEPAQMDLGGRYPVAWSGNSQPLTQPKKFDTKFCLDRSGKQPRYLRGSEAVPMRTFFANYLSDETLEEKVCAVAPSDEVKAEGKKEVARQIETIFRPLLGTNGTAEMLSLMENLLASSHDATLGRVVYEGSDGMGEVLGVDDLKEQASDALQVLDVGALGRFDVLDEMLWTCEGMYFDDLVRFRDFFRSALCLVAASRGDKDAINAFSTCFSFIEHEGGVFAAFVCPGFGPWGIFENYFEGLHPFANWTDLATSDRGKCEAAFRSFYGDAAWDNRNAIVFPIRGLRCIPEDEERIAAIADVSNRSLLFLLSLYSEGKTSVPVDAGRMRANGKIEKPRNRPLVNGFFETLAWILGTGQAVHMCTHCHVIPVIRGSASCTCSAACRTLKSRAKKV